MVSGAHRWEEAATTRSQEDGVAALVVGDLRAVARARRFVFERVVAHGLDELAADAELVASEVVTNALLHAGPPVELSIRITPPRVRVEVSDRTRSTPVPLGAGGQSMTGRGLSLIEGLTRAWGVAPNNGGKTVWAELEAGAAAPSDLDAEALIALWAEEELPRDRSTGDPVHTVRLGDVPTDLLLTAKAHVDDLVREFSLAASGASSGLTAQVPANLAELIEAVVYRFSEPRESIRRQALAARQRGEDHVTLELRLPASAADAGEAYLRALDEADAYSRAARLLTLESPPQHRVFRHWYVEELIAQLRRAAAGGEPVPTEPFEQRLLREIDRMAEHERRVTRAARLYDLATALARALSPEAVVRTALSAGATALGASGGAVLLPGGARLVVPGTVGYDPPVVARLREESPDAELPAATSLRTGESVWLESPAERDARFPGLAGLEPGTVSVVAVPIETGARRLGALRFSFTQARLFDEDERSFVMAIAAQTAQALERAQLSSARTDAARRLQRSLLPPALPDLEGLRISTAYQPLTDSLEIGGDFYDVWERGTHRLALVIGDVCGHGPEAAAVSALVRHTLRALTMTSADAITILRRLDGALRDALEGSDRFATVTFGFLTVGPDACTLDLVGGGHPGPVLVRAGGRAEVLEVGGSLLGIIDDPRIGWRRLALRRGEEIVLVTDGVTDARDERGGWFGHDGVKASAAAAISSGTDTAEAISQAVLAHTGGHLQDDFAVLALRWDGR